MTRYLKWVLGLALCAFVLCGCVTLSDPESSQEYDAAVVGTVDSDHTIGQTFVARRPRLNGVELWLSRSVSSGSLTQGTLIVELFPGLQETTPLAFVRLPISAAAGSPIRVMFPQQSSLPDQRYYLRLKTSGPSVAILGRNEDAYPNGQAFRNGVPVEADIAFRLLYDYDAAAVLDDLHSLASGVWLVFPLCALFLLPGWVMLNLGNLRHRFDRGEQVALAVGLSSALVPLILLWTTVLGLRWSQTAVLIGVGLLAAVPGWRVIRRLAGRGAPRIKVPPTASSLGRGWRWSLTGIFILSLGIRLAMIRDLAAPAWVDSVHHTLITQLIVNEGSLPSSYAPFVSATTVSYHTGFHTMVATFHWLSGLDVVTALLIVGQVLNALMVFSAYLLAKELTGDRLAGLVAAASVGLFSPMPAYYTSWGRYTQLAGLLVLPVAFTLARRSLLFVSHQSNATHHEQGGGRNSIALATVAVGGLVLIHYRVAAFLACLLFAHWLGQRYRRDVFFHQVTGAGLRLGAIGGGAMLLTLPWVIPTFTTLWLPKLEEWSRAEPFTYFDFSWAYLTPRMGKYLLVLGLIGLVWGLLRRRRFALILALWVVFLFLLASPGLVGLPGGGFVSFVSVEISLFLPLSILVGYAVSQLLSTLLAVLPARWKVPYIGAFTLLGISLAFFGARTLLPILNVDTVLYRKADESAMAWIRENTSNSAKFLINPMTWYPQMYVGHDGGYWIAPLANRETIPPPALYGFGSVEDILAIDRICSEVIGNRDEPEALWPLLREEDITHIYIGARGGVLSPKALVGSAHYRAVYSRDGTWVFEVLP